MAGTHSTCEWYTEFYFKTANQCLIVTLQCQLASTDSLVVSSSSSKDEFGNHIGCEKQKSKPIKV